MRNFKYQLSLLFAVSALFFSCGRTSPSVPMIEFDMKVFDTCSIKSADTISGSLTQDWLRGLYDSQYGLVIGQEKGGAVIHVIDSITSELKYSFGQFGRGPNEFISPILVNFDYERDFLYVNDVPKGELSRVVLQENSAYIDTSFRIQGLYTGWVGIDDSLCIALLNYDNKAMLVMKNENQKEKEQLVLHNLLDDRRIKTPLFLTNQSKLGIARQRHVVLCTGINLPVVTCYKYTPESLTLQWRMGLEKDMYRMEGRTSYAKDDIQYEINRMYFTNQYIYLTITKKSKFADGYNYLLRLDYTGRTVNAYKVVCDFYCFIITQDDSTLVGVVSKSEEDPDGYLVKVAL